MDKTKPLFSIITVVYNGEKTIEETIKSILAQTYKNVEYIIIDGASTDGTVEIIKKYNDEISYWVSEKDTGIYDAMNKGIRASHGEIIGIVNADDTLYSNTLKEVQEQIILNNLDYTYGSVHLMDEEGVVFGETVPMKEEDIDVKKYVDMPFPHPSLFVKKEIYEQIGLFDIKFKLSADYDFVLRLLAGGYKGLALSSPTSKFRSGGNSGGISTFLDTKNVLLSHNAPKTLVYKNMFASIAKVLLLRYFPNISLKLRQKFRQKSRHKLYGTSSDLKHKDN